MKRKGAEPPLASTFVGCRPDDIFTSLIGDRLPHIGIVADRRGASGNWAVIHNIGARTRG